MEKIVMLFVLSLMVCLNAPSAFTAQVPAVQESQSYVVKLELLPSLSQNRRSNGPVECYVCNDCDKPSSSELRTCPQSANRYADGKCVTYVTEFFNGTKQFSRNCVSLSGSCLDIKRWSSNNPNAKSKSCQECESDKCNDERNSASAVAASLLFILLPTLTTKFLL